jgi:glycosyltransferase involved in cell wall biosynthesis
MRREVQFQLASQEHSEWNNIFLDGCTITLPEIPSLIEHIGCYESILEESAVTVQVVLYDFIPFFHAWTVHPGNRGHLNSYVRIVLLAHRIISISALVQEQAKLIIQAFSLERESWGKRSRSFDYLPLPSGLEGARTEEFSKDSQLLTMVGSLEPRKNHLQFLAALEILAARGVSFKARILGSAGWENDHILDRIYSLQAKGIDVERVGNLTDIELRSIIGTAQVLVQVSEAEGFGLPIAEALSLGTRVIVSNVSPLKEWAGERVSVVEIGNSVELADQMMQYLQNSEKFGVTEAQSISWKDWQNLLYGRKKTTIFQT